MSFKTKSFLVCLLVVLFCLPAMAMNVSSVSSCDKDSYLKSFVWTIYYEDSCGSDIWKFYTSFQLREVFEDGVWKKKIYNRFGTTHTGYWSSDGSDFSLDFFSALMVEMDYTGCSSLVSGYSGDGHTSNCLFYPSRMIMIRGSAIQ